MEAEISNMNQDTPINRVLTDPPIPTTLKRKRGPSHSDGISGDPLSGGKPALKQSRDIGVEEPLAEEIVPEEDEESDFDDSDSSGISQSPQCRRAIT